MDSAALLKAGTGTATFLNSGADGYRGGVIVGAGKMVLGSDNSISGGVIVSNNATLQIGTNGGSGTLPSGTSFDDGTLIFNRGADLSVDSVIAGAATGSILKTNSGVLALNAANTFTGAVVVVGGTVQAGNAAALGRTNSGTTISSGGTLDVNGLSLGFEPVTVVGDGVGNNGALYNSGADQTAAFRRVTLAGNTTFGGTGRWDVRSSNLADSSLGSLLSGGQPYNITKVGQQPGLIS